MKLREFLNTCQNDLAAIHLYLDDEEWEEATPRYSVSRMRSIDDADLEGYVDAWSLENKGTELHILVTV